MKKTIVIFTVLLVFVFIKTNAQPDQQIDFNYFYSALQPYGEWIDLGDNLIVWRPNGTREGWRPYSEGQWTWTDQGWYWDSNEDFGWATYHYGRWYNDKNYGWIWFPDYQWGPSWVEWRYDNDNIGWAPLPPYADFNSNKGIRFSTEWHSPYNYWNFVSYRRFGEPRLNMHLLDASVVFRIFERTTYRNNYYSDHNRIVNSGIDRSFLEKKIGARIIEKKLAQVDNMRDYNRSRKNMADKVFTYKPSVREMAKSRSIDKFNIRKGEKTSSIVQNKLRTQDKRDFHRTETNIKTSEKVGKTSPNVSQQRNAPNMNQQRNTPNVNQQRNVPNVNQQRTSPNVNQQKNVPNVNQQRNAPNVNQQKNAPVKTPQKPAPAVNQQRTAPAKTPQKPAPVPQKKDDKKKPQ